MSAAPRFEPVLGEGDPVGDVPRRIPAARYVDRAFFAREQEKLWPQVWQMACTEDCVAQPGDWYEYRAGALSALIVRGADGVLRAFRNLCRHRASPLLEGSGQGLSAIACPYHNWRYRLDGKADASGAGDPKLGLLPLALGCWAGIVFVSWAEAPEPLERFLGAVPGELAWLGLERYTCRYALTVPVACNWKLVMDAFNESYHIHAVHPQLLAAANDKDLPIRLLGRHSYFEQAFGVASPRLAKPGVAPDDVAMWHAFLENVGHRIGLTFAAAAAPAPLPAIPPGQTLRDVLAQLIRQHLKSLGDPYPDAGDRALLNDFHYYVFPNLIFNVFAGWFSIVRARPVDAGHSLVDMWNFDLLPEGHADAHAKPQPILMQPEECGALGRVVVQDIELLPRLQRGLSEPGIEPLRLTDEEIRIGHMHRILDRYLGTKVAEEVR